MAACDTPAMTADRTLPETGDFLETLYERHARITPLPGSEATWRLAERVLHTLFPEQTGECLASRACLRAELAAIEAGLLRLLAPLWSELPARPEEIADAFMAALPTIYGQLSGDAEATHASDPAASSVYEVMRAYPGFYALAMYRQAHVLRALGVPLLPRIVTERAHGRTGIDIHPGAQIGERCTIDHGTGLVIGETATVGDDVRLFHGVTLGSLSVSKAQAGTKRHPTVESRVVVYAGATILGGDTVIGADSVIGGNVWLTHSVPPGSRVYHQGQVRLTEPQER